MIVTFVSQCEKKALNRTRRVLDAFAVRIGDRTWQTQITRDGLTAVKKLLRKTASKNTAVACHRIRGYQRVDLEWIVGNREKFNRQGITPVNTTRKDIIHSKWENDWHYLPLIKALSAMAALLHDWGKATQWFQEKLLKKTRKKIGDPLRHEWITGLVLCALAGGHQNDDAWLSRLETGEVDEKKLLKRVAELIEKSVSKDNKKIFGDLPELAGILIWLILSHHRLPLQNKNKETLEEEWLNVSAKSIPIALNRITPEWGYKNHYGETEFRKNLSRCLKFPQGLPCRSKDLQKELKRWAGKAKASLELLQAAVKDGSIRAVLFHTRLCLMLGDYHYSSKDPDPKWKDTLNLIANTDPKTRHPKQKLDEHLVGVAKSALRTSHLLPAFERDAPFAHDVQALKRKSDEERYKWQDKAVAKISSWKKNLPESADRSCYGFFAVNMAGTGCGKTLANAKIMRMHSEAGQSLRYILALGLRTLTLQTGDEYRERIGLDSSELAVVIGSKAVMDLHKLDKLPETEDKKEGNERLGSESLESLLDEEVDYDVNIPEEGLATIFGVDRDKKNAERARKFLFAPVLACTIDHIMGATETKRGGRYILPALRLLSSDLVIDEVDDFCGDDLIAIGRLIHLAGMLGRKVMLSSATIPPDLAEGYFNAYREGWVLFSKTRDVGAAVGCALIDEKNTRVTTIAENETDIAIKAYKEFHADFVEKLIKHLNAKPAKRRATIISCGELYALPFCGEEKSGYTEIQNAYFELIKSDIITKHGFHHTEDPRSNKRISFGVVRMANINPCIECAEYLTTAAWPRDCDVKIMAYHSRQVLLLRHDQEQHLDAVLKRKEEDGETPAAFENPIIRNHIDTSAAADIIFILVASPVEEIGRDHDFDWAIPEPSSYRAIIQLAGRVLRHRGKCPEQPNMGVMQYNLRALKYKGGKPAFCRPGYETGQQFKLNTHDLTKLVDESALARRIDATPRIKRNQTLYPQEKLADLEHYVMESLLTAYKKHGPESLQGWLTQHWWLTALPQTLSPFRASEPEIKLILVYDEDKDEFYFAEKNDNGEPVNIEKPYNIEKRAVEREAEKRLWLRRDYLTSLERIIEKESSLSLRAASLKYGEINIPIYSNSAVKYVYSDQFGFKKET